MSMQHLIGRLEEGVKRDKGTGFPLVAPNEVEAALHSVAKHFNGKIANVDWKDANPKEGKPLRAIFFFEVDPAAVKRDGAHGDRVQDLTEWMVAAVRTELISTLRLERVTGLDVKVLNASKTDLAEGRWPLYVEMPRYATRFESDMRSMRGLVRRLEEHVATRSRDAYVSRQKTGDGPWQEYAQTDNWYSDRLHDALHKVLDHVEGLSPVSHGSASVPSWFAHGLSKDEAEQIYKKSVDAINAAKAKLHIVGGKEKVTASGLKTVYGEDHGSAAIEVSLFTKSQDGKSSVSVDFHSSAGMYHRQISREAGVTQRPRNDATPLLKDFDFDAE